AAKRPAPEEEKHLSDYWYVLLRRRNLALAVAAAITALVSVRSFLTRPVYEASVQILIERETPSVLNFKEVAQIDAIRDDYYQTQYKLLQSRALVRKVVERLNLLADPEFGGPRSAQEIAAIRAQPPGASQVMEAAISAFASRLRVQPVRNSRLVTVTF